MIVSPSRASDSAKTPQPASDAAVRGRGEGWRIAAHGFLLCAPFVLLVSTKRSWLPVTWLLILIVGLARAPAVSRAIAALWLPLLSCTALALSYLLPEWLHGSVAPDEWRRLLAPILVFGFGVIAYAVRPDARWIWFGLAAAGIWTGARGSFEIAVLDFSRNVLGGTNAVAFGGAAALLALACGYGWAMRSGGAEQRMLAIGTLCAAVACILSQTRGAWLTLPLLAVAPLVAARATEGSGTPVRRAMVPLLLLPTAAALVVGWERLLRGFDEVRLYFDGALIDSSVGIRLSLWRISWQQFLDHPWIGAGAAGWKQAVATWADTQAPLWALRGIQHAHNDVIDALAQRGVIGLAGYVAFIGGWFLFFVRRPRFSAAAVSGCLVLAAAVIMGLTDAFMFSSTTFFLLCWVLGCFALLAIEDDEATRHESARSTAASTSP